jgi:cardiolipin synthase
MCVNLLAICTGCANNDPTERPYKIVHTYGVSDPEFNRTLGNLLGPPLIGGNRVTTLVNGNRIFPPMLKAIRSAKTTINIETYIYWSGAVGREFSLALSERARSGVKVRVIIDTIGSMEVDQRDIKAMTDAGVRLVKFHPLRWYEFGPKNKTNNRTHRKLLIIDGRLGFTGGVGIADEWLGNADSLTHWRDNHYMIEGPAVAQLQAAFADNWMGTTGEVLHGDTFFPELENAGKEWAQVFNSSSRGGSESMELMFILSIAAAEKNIRLASAYFVPDDVTVQALIDARARGVKVQIIVPGETIDKKIVRNASRARWGDLLRIGVEIYEYQPTMYHTKAMIVDDAWVSIGSANLDNRSFQLNDETNLNLLDHIFAMQQVRIFDDDLSHSRQITYELWQKRSAGERFFQAITSPFGWLM